MGNSKISGFYKKSIQERLRILQQTEFLNEEDYILLKNGNGVLRSEESDKMIENVISSYIEPIYLFIWKGR